MGRVVLALWFATSLAACSRDTATVQAPTSDVDTSVVASQPEADEPTRIEIELPIIPPVALPDISVLGTTGDIVGERLGDLISPVNGVDLVTATCVQDEAAEGGGELVYSGTTGTDVFTIARDGSGGYVDESDDGLVTLQVAADGTGSYYDESSGGLITIDVLPDGSGTYYAQRREGLVTVEIDGDGSGSYYDDRDGLLTVTLADGGGEYVRETEDDLLTIDVGADGSGEYYHRDERQDLVTTIRVEADGRWVLTTSNSSRSDELTVEPDGSGRYRQTGLVSNDISFDRDGKAPGRLIVLPEPPTLSVADRFPELGKLGSLSPPCATIIRFDSQLLFDFDDTELRPEAGEALDRVVAALAEAGEAIEINGHSDSLGPEDYNLELSTRRAEAVEVALRKRGLAVDVVVNGFGETRPVAPNETDTGQDDPAGRSLNRRVEIVIREP